MIDSPDSIGGNLDEVLYSGEGELHYIQPVCSLLFGANGSDL